MKAAAAVEAVVAEAAAAAAAVQGVLVSFGHHLLRRHRLRKR